MDSRQDIVYRYDGSWPGFLCCVFAAVYRRELPFAILPWDQPLLTLFEEREIETEPEKARRVDASFPKKLGPTARNILMRAFLCDDPDKEIAILRLLLLGYKTGPQVFKMLGHSDVAPVLAMADRVSCEAHQFKGFLRFVDYGEFLGAVIEPKNYVLPILRWHFCSRYPDENFIIYDKTHGGALLYEDHSVRYAQLTEPPWFPRESAEEQAFQQMWKTFYKTIEVKARENLDLRRSNCPKRYWSEMTELKEEQNKTVQNWKMTAE